MSKLPEKVCLYSLLARSASPPGQEWADRFAWCWQITSDIPGPSAPQGPPSWANCLKSTKSFWQEPGVSHPCCPALIPSMAKQTAALGPLSSPLAPLGGCAVKGRQ